MIADLPVRMAVVGLGTAGRSMLAPTAARSDVRLSAVVDTNEAVRAEIGRRYNVPAFATLADALRETPVDGVYIATPTEFHTEHVLAAVGQGKHVIVEKPMAIAMEDADRMVDAAAAAGVVLIVGHSHGFDEPYAAMRELIAGGELGRLRMLTSIVYTDWVYRPRRPEELDVSLGGGVVFRQGAHQFDVLRVIAGGTVASVRAATHDFDSARSTIGAYSALLTFQNGVSATAVYNGYGAFLTPELCYGIGETGEIPEDRTGSARREHHQRSVGDELRAKVTRAASRLESLPPHQPFYGWLIASCEQGDIRQSPDGLYIYSVRGKTELPLPVTRSTRDAVLAEFIDSIAGRRKPLHDGRWGRANLELCFAVLRSGTTAAEVKLIRQSPFEGHAYAY